MMTSQVLRALEQRGLVERPADPTDARARRVVVTSAGAALARRSLRRVEAADAEFFAGTLRVPFLSALNQLATRTTT
jgi:DNA-binding MarR family transcriptional regulator